MSQWGDVTVGGWRDERVALMRGMSTMCSTGRSRATLFDKPADYAAFEKVVRQAWERALQAGKSTTVAALALHTALRSDDSALVAAIVAELSAYDISVAHNGARFDLPFLRTRFAKWGLDPLASKKLVDPVQLARSQAADVVQQPGGDCQLPRVQ